MGRVHWAGLYLLSPEKERAILTRIVGILVFLPQHPEPMYGEAAGGLADVFMDVLHHLEAVYSALLRQLVAEPAREIH